MFVLLIGLIIDGVAAILSVILTLVSPRLKLKVWLSPAVSLLLMIVVWKTNSIIGAGDNLFILTAFATVFSIFKLLKLCVFEDDAETIVPSLEEQLEMKKAIRTSDSEQGCRVETGPVNYVEAGTRGGVSSGDNSEEVEPLIDYNNKKDFIDTCQRCGFDTEGKTVDELVAEVKACTTYTQRSSVPSNISDDDYKVVMYILKTVYNKK